MPDSSPPTALEGAVLILQALSIAADVLADLRDRRPSVDELRPQRCPLEECGTPAFTPDGPLGIVGHGTYERQVLGLAGVAGQVVVRVQRFLCRGCRHTISVLPDALYPGRWYGAWVILEALVLAQVLGVPVAEIRRQFGVDGAARGWRSLTRWRRELLCPLWRWLARGLGVRGPCGDDAVARLTRLLAQVGEDARKRGGGARAAPLLLAGRAHDRGRSWLPEHDRPGRGTATSRA